MTEIAFPLLGAAFVVLVLLPAVALIAKGVLVLLERAPLGHGALQHELSLRYLILTGSSFLPVAWFVSAGVHQAESGRSAMSCLFEHSDEPCFEAGLFAVSLALIALRGIGSALFRGHGAQPAIARSPRADRVRARVAALCAQTPQLAELTARVEVTEAKGFALATLGLARGFVLVGAEYAEALSDDALAAALAHEAEHVRAHDPLRYAGLDAALSMNPFGRGLLEPHARRFIAAHEAHCDRQAVVHGSAPLALAEALVLAARPRTAKPDVLPALGASDTAVIKLRVDLLLAFAERAPVACCHRAAPSLRAALLLVVLAACLPHGTSTAALDVLHAGAEHAVAGLLR